MQNHNKTMKKLHLLLQERRALDKKIEDVMEEMDAVHLSDDESKGCASCDSASELGVGDLVRILTKPFKGRKAEVTSRRGHLYWNIKVHPRKGDKQSPETWRMGKSLKLIKRT